MTPDELIAILADEENEEFLQFSRIEKKLSTRPDLHAFILLGSLVSGLDDLICAAEHDEFFIGIGLEELAPVITKEQAIDLVRCGVRYDASIDSLAMFV